MNILFDYSFLTVALGTCLLAIASSCIGTVSVLTHQSLIGDTVGHAAYPGVIFSFMLFQSRNPLLLMLGALFSGFVSYHLVYWVKRHSNHSYINILALISSTFFGLGMVLKQYIQGNAAYGKAAQAGLQKYLFGQAAFIQQEDVFLIGGVSLLCLSIFFILYQSFRIYLFDQTFAKTIGISNKLLENLSIFMMICLIAVGLKVVGAILMSSFLICPAVFGFVWNKHYKRALFSSSLVSVSCAFVGTLLSSIYSGLSTGATIIVLMSILTIGSIFIQKIRKGGA